MAVSRWQIQGHGGAGDLCSDNTQEAFEMAWSLGIIPEADVRMSRDGVLVAFHDDSFQRVAQGKDAALAHFSVAELDWERLSIMDVGSYRGAALGLHRIPCLKEVFGSMRGQPERRLYLDLKEAPLGILARAVEEAGVQSQVIFATSNYPLIQEWKTLLPAGRTLLWMGARGEAADRVLEGRFEEFRKQSFSALTELQIHAFLRQPVESIRRDSRDPFTPSDAFFRKAASELKKQGILFQSLPWGGTTPEVYWKLLDLGVESFATDSPLVTLAALENYQPLDRE